MVSEGRQYLHDFPRCFVVTDSLARQYILEGNYKYLKKRNWIRGTRFISSMDTIVLYASETWQLTLREESRLRVFENRVLRRVFGPKRDEVKEKWRKLHNEELRDL